MSRAPKVNVSGDGSQTIELGWMIKLVLASGLASVLAAAVGFPILVKDVAANDEEIETIKKAQAVFVRNQGVLDEEVRGLRADSRWSGEKLDALLEANGVTKRIPRPQVEDSNLETVE